MRILLVEDQGDIATMYELGLQAAGHEVVVAVTGHDGLGRAAELRPGFIMLDVGLPDMSGLDVLEILRQGSPGIEQRLPVALLTNYSDADYRARADRLGVLQYLVKTEVRPTRLAEIVDRWIAEGVAWPEEYRWDDLVPAADGIADHGGPGAS